MSCFGSQKLSRRILMLFYNKSCMIIYINHNIALNYTSIGPKKLFGQHLVIKTATYYAIK